MAKKRDKKEILDRDTMATSKKSTEATIFIRFVPPCAAVRRHHLEALCSEYGPIKKSAVIHKNNNNDDDETTSSSFAFVKYTCQADAVVAAQALKGRSLKIDDHSSPQLQVELATSAVSTTTSTKHQQQQALGQQQPQKNNSAKTNNKKHPKQVARVIVRNLSFYAKESHIRQTLTRLFGPITDVHLPLYKAKSHRGFGFVTFARAQDAQACVSADQEIVIAKRPVQIAWSIPRDVYEGSQKKKYETEKMTDDSAEKDEIGASDDSNSSDTSSDEDEEAPNDENTGGNDNHSDDDSSGSNSTGDDSANVDADDSAQQGASLEKKEDDQSKTVFLRNLPFDATRHDLFELLRRYGHINSIYLVKDSQTGLPKGTAFVSFATDRAVQAALQASGCQTEFLANQNKQQASTAGSSGITLKGRQIFLNPAVDKNTAATLTAEKQQQQHRQPGRDRRNLYLKEKGRVHDGDWDVLPESDKSKRQAAWKDKNTKLQSPLFFINPTRLSIRNLAKHVDETDLKKLVVAATARGLERQLVSADDQVAHWRASGDFSTRDILQRLQADGDTQLLLPELDTKNIKKYIPSVFISREFPAGRTNNNITQAPSRGFGFVEFEHHVHALACLEELNNNARYSADYAAGGRQRRRSTDGGGGIPRLIVEFSVENKVKAKQQADHRAARQANKIKQKMLLPKEQLEPRKKRKSRGALQRERKRNKREQTNNNDEKALSDAEAPEKPDGAQPKMTARVPVVAAKKPEKKKKQKLDAEEENFRTLVESYKQSFAALETTQGADKRKGSKKSGSRWFAD